MNPDQGIGLAPQLIQLVIVPFLRGKDVDDDSTVIHEKPPGVSAALIVMRPDPLLL